MEHLIEKGLIGLAIIASAYLIYIIGVWLLRKFMKKLFDFAIFYPTAKAFWKCIVVISAIAIGFQHVLTVSAAHVLTTLGIGGVTLGIAAQGFIKDLLMGIVILVSQSFQLGDTIIVKNNLRGKVDKITLQYTRLAGENGEKHVISNSEMTMITVIKP